MSNFRDDTLWIVVAGFVVCFLMAMAMGANDVANAFGTSVGAGVITLKQAFCIAAACNFLGALLMSRAVTETIRKGIVDLQGFDDDPEELMLLMLCAMVGSVCYVAGATALRLPVSTTQAILGGLVGASIVRDGDANGVRWADRPVCAYSAKTGRFSCGGIAGVVLQWFFAPLIAMALAVLCFELSRRVLLNASKENALWRAPAFMASLNGLVFFALAWFIVVQNQYHPHSRGWEPRDADSPVNTASPLEVVACLFIGGTVTLLSFATFYCFPKTLKFAPADVGGGPAAPDGLELQAGGWADTGEAGLADVNLDDPPPPSQGDETSTSPKNKFSWAEAARTTPFATEIGDDAQKVHAAGRDYDPEVERVFGSAQLFTSALAAFASGANDVANEVAPVAAIYQTHRDRAVVATARTPKWLFAYAGLGICAGLFLFGERVMRTVGRDATKMTPARSFNIQLGFALASLVASAEGWPVSTTQLCVGAVVGVGLASGEDVSEAVNKKLLGKIFLSWVCTPLAAGTLSAAAYAALKGIL